MARIQESSVVRLLRVGVVLVLLCLLSSCQSPPQIQELRTVPPEGPVPGGGEIPLEAIIAPPDVPVTFHWVVEAGEMQVASSAVNRGIYHAPTQAGTYWVKVEMFDRGKKVAEKALPIKVVDRESPSRSSILRDGDDFEAFSLSWHRWKGNPSGSDGELRLVGPADIQTNDNYQSQELTVRAKAEQWAPDTSIGFEVWDRDIHYSIRVSRGKLIVETSGVGSHEAPIPNWPALRTSPFTLKISWSGGQVKLHIDNQPLLDYTGPEVPTRPLKVRLSAASSDTLTVSQIKLEYMKPQPTENPIALRGDLTVPSITILEEISDTRHEKIQSDDAPHIIYTRGVASNSKNYYIYLVVNDFNAEWIQPTSGLGKNVEKDFSGNCYLGIANDSGSRKKWYEISAVATDREYKEYDHLDRKTIKAESNKIKLYRTRD